jgi:hypothetical protein
MPQQEAVMLVLLMGGIYEAATEMTLGAMTSTPRLTHVGSGIQKLLGRYFYFLAIWEVGQKLSELRMAVELQFNGNRPRGHQ